MSEQPTEVTEPDTGKPEDNGAAVRLAGIKAKRQSVARAQRAVEECTEDLKEAKGTLGRATLRLHSEIDDDQLPLAFSEPADAEAWREEVVITLGLPEGITAKLADAGIATLGQLQTYCKTELLTDIDGIGDGARDKIETALEKHWAQCGMVSNVDGEGEPVEERGGVSGE